MIIQKDDIYDLERQIDEYSKHDIEWLDYYDFDPVKYFGEHPYLLFPLDFSENRKLYFHDYLWDFEYEYEKTIDYELKHREIEKAIIETELFIKRMGFDRNIEFMNRDLEYAFKNDLNGSWYWFDGIDNNELYFNGYINKNIPIHELLKKLYDLLDKPDNNPHSIIYPRSFLDFNDRFVNNFNYNIIESIKKIQKNEISLTDINPFEFEDIIAELLINSGLQIHKTPRTRDGGRDIVARGEIVPGFPILMAVEVKKKNTVNIDDVRNALYANRNYPKIMIVTSGRFSAGVYRCKRTEENIFRLDLKDGIAVSQLIHGYNINR